MFTSPYTHSNLVIIKGNEKEVLTVLSKIIGDSGRVDMDILQPLPSPLNQPLLLEETVESRILCFNPKLDLRIPDMTPIEFESWVNTECSNPVINEFNKTIDWVPEPLYARSIEDFSDSVTVADYLNFIIGKIETLYMVEYNKYAIMNFYYDMLPRLAKLLVLSIREELSDKTFEVLGHRQSNTWLETYRGVNQRQGDNTDITRKPGYAKITFLTNGNYPSGWFQKLHEYTQSLSLEGFNIHSACYVSERKELTTQPQGEINESDQH